MKKLICIVGKTRSGKDQISKILKQKKNINQIVSYTTRPKRPEETDDVEHHFISNTEANMMLVDREDDILAYAKKPSGVQYFALISDIVDDITTYIIDPEGLRILRKKHEDKFQIIAVYVEANENDIIERAEKLGNNIAGLKSRLKDEQFEFDSFRDSKEYDFVISNLGTLEELEHEVNRIFQTIHENK